jgi:5-methylcytosine-specific restriction protein A
VQPFLGHSERWRKERRAIENAQRDPVIARMYASRDWSVLRLKVLSLFRYRCATPACANKASIVDHVRPHHGEADLFYDEANLQALCKRCHDRKTAREDGGFGRRRIDD